MSTIRLSYLFLLSFLFASCFETEIKVKEYKGLLLLENINFEIIKVMDLPWRVGLKTKNKVTVSKGIIIGGSIPQISESDQELIRSKGADTWLLKVTRQGNSGSEVIGYVQAPFFKPKSSLERLISKNTSSKVFVRINYTAVHINRLLERLPCPPFGHDKKFSGHSINNSVSMGVASTLTVFPTERMDILIQKIEASSFQSVEFNGGMSLEGDYIFSWALFNSQELRLYSDFIEAKTYLHLGQEDIINVPGCENYQIPPLEEQQNINPFRCFNKENCQ